MKNFKEINRTFTVKTNSIFNAVCKTRYLALLVVLIFTCGNVWGASPATLTFTAACGGSGTDSDGNTWTVTSDAAESNYDATKGIHYGTGKVAVSYLNLTTSGISGTITQIQVNASGASSTSAKLDVTVGGSAFGAQQSLTSSATTYTLTGSASGTIVVAITQSSATKALYCKSITVTYSSGGGGCSAPDAPTISGTAAYTEGQTITLTATCASGADASTTYTWYKGADWATASAASPVQAATTGSSGYTFTKANCVTGDAGKYWCKASNGSGCDANNATGYDITVSAWSGTEYVLVTSTEDLEAGANYVIGSADATSGYFMSTAVSTNNRQRTASITISNTNKITTTAEVLVLELGGDATDGWTFETTNYLGADGYLTSAASGSNNHCKVVTQDEACSYFTIEFSGNAAVITSNGRNERNILKYNSSNNPPIFACYSSGQNPVYLYKEVGSCTAPDHVNVTGRWDRFGGETISLTATPYDGSDQEITTDITGYQWQKYYNSTWNDIAGATSATYTKSNCDKDDSGSYRCQVSTGSGCTTASDGFQVKVYVLECYTGGTTIYNFTRIGDTQAGTAQITLSAGNKTFKFHADNDYYGNDGTINEDVTNWVCSTSESDNLTIAAGLGGTFTINMEYSTGGNSSVEGEPEISVTYPRKTIYLTPGVWNVDGAQFAFYYFRDGGSNGWTGFITPNDCGSSAEIPQWNGVKIDAVRLKNTCSSPNWSDKWGAQTSDITVSSNNSITITGWNEGDYTYGTYSVPTYTISYATGSTTHTSGNAISGSHANDTKTCGLALTLPAAQFTTTGYTQTGWSKTDGGSQDVALSGSYTDNVAQTFYPVWTVNSHTLTWDFDGGSSSETAGTDYTAGGSVNYGTTIDYPTNASMSKTGYTFNGWSSSPTTMPDDNLTLIAQWSAKTDTYKTALHTSASGWTTYASGVTKSGVGYEIPAPSSVTKGATSTCEDTHYHFAGWVADEYKGSPSGHIIAASGTTDATGTTYWAVWEKEADGGGSSTDYELVTSSSTALADGDEIIIATSGTAGDANAVAMGYSRGNNRGVVGVTIASGPKISNPTFATETDDDDHIFPLELEADGNYFRIKDKVNDDYLAALGGTSNNYLKLYGASTNTGARQFTISVDASGVASITANISGNNKRDKMKYNSGNNPPIISCYNSGYNSLYIYRKPGVTYEDPIATCGEEYDITIDKNNASATCTSCGAKVTANATTLSNLVAPTWAGHQVDYYMVDAAAGSTKIAEADGTLAANVSVSSTPWTDANGKWVKADDATFYAKWKATECVITLNNEGATEPGTTSVTATYGANTNLTTSIATPTKNGYDFGGYFTEAGGAGTQLINADGSWKASVTGYTNASKQWQLDATALELHAKWTLKSYTVTWVVNGETEATQTSVYYGTAYSDLTEEPDVADNALSDCGSDKFVGWVTQEYTAEGGTAAAQYDPYKISASILIDDNHHTFYAMFAKEEGTAFTLDGEVGSTQDVNVFYTDGTNNYYATGNIGATSNGKIDSSTDVADANTYVFTKTGTGTYTIQKKNDANYIKYNGSTDLGTQAPAYTWTISDVSSTGLGSWRLQSATNGRAWICATTGTPKFGGYSTGNVTSSQPYRDVELGSSNLTDYRTGCCSEKITLTVSDATSGVGGTVTMKWNNADKSAGDQVSTCSAGTLVAKVTANPGYILTAMAISGTNKSITITPSDLTTGLPSTEEMTYSVAVQALATGTLTITPTFSRTYTVTYDLAGGETSGSTATVRYQSGEQVTLVTPDPIKSGYNFSEWNVTKEGGGNVTVSSGKFTMPTDNVTVTATWTEKTLTSIILGSASVEVYVGQYVEIPVTYDPADILTKNYTLVANPSYCVTTGSTITTLKITGGRGGVTITENKTETVSIKANADNTKTASVSVTVKPLPVDHYVDLIHGVSFDDKGSTIVNNELSATYTAPGYGDYSGSTTGDCETNHLHLVGWIDSEWADAHPKASHTEIIAAEGYHTAREAGMTASNKTYYAVWGDEQ